MKDKERNALERIVSYCNHAAAAKRKRDGGVHEFPFGGGRSFLLLFVAHLLHIVR